MPKIGKRGFKISNRIHELDIYYRSKDKIFYFNRIHELFPEVIRLSGFTNSARTEDELVFALISALETYHKLIEKRRKVIAYKFLVAGGTAQINTPMKSGGTAIRRKPWAKNLGVFGHPEDQGFSIRYEILYEITGKEVEYRDLDGYLFRMPLHDNSWIIIDYTEEREKAFDEINEAIERMVSRISAIVSDTKEFTNLLDKGLKLLN